MEDLQLVDIESKKKDFFTLYDEMKVISAVLRRRADKQYKGEEKILEAFRDIRKSFSRILKLQKDSFIDWCELEAKQRPIVVAILEQRAHLLCPHCHQLVDGQFLNDDPELAEEEVVDVECLNCFESFEVEVPVATISFEEMLRHMTEGLDAGGDANLPGPGGGIQHDNFRKKKEAHDRFTGFLEEYQTCVQKVDECIRYMKENIGDTLDRYSHLLPEGKFNRPL